MATPKLNTGKVGAAPVRTLRPSGSAPAKQIKLKGATGKTIEPKKAAPKPATEASAKEETVVPAPVEETPLPVAETAPETIETVDPQAAAEAEAARLAQEEYERQMEEYNRQMEEYNRQMAEYQAAAEQAAAEETPTEEVPYDATTDETVEAIQEIIPEEQPDKPSPTEKIRAAKGNKPKSNISVAGGKKKKKTSSTSSDSDISDEEQATRDAYMRALAEENSRQPVWKSVPFMVGAGLLVVTIGVCTILVVQKQAEDARIQAHIDYTNSLLKRAQAINMQAVENLTDAAKKGVDVSCSMDDAKALMEVVVDPFVLGENGKPRYGARAEGVAQNACLLLGLAAEQDEAIRDMIFDTMGKNCNKITPSLFHWLLQRVAISDAKNINATLKKLSKTVAEKKTAKPWLKKSQILGYIWESIGLRVTASDTKEILDLLKSDIADNTLAPYLCNCLDNILMMMDDADEKAKIGDEIFTNMPEKLRTNLTIAGTLARACSPKALEFYKSEIEGPKGWSGVAPAFIGSWGSDDILDYVLAAKEANASNAKASATIKEVIGTILKQDRPRSIEAANKLLSMSFENPFGDTANIQDIINKTDAMSTLYIGDDHPDLPKLQAQLKELEALRKQKQVIIRVLNSLMDHEWVVSILERYKNDKDEDIQIEAEKALENVRAHSVHNAKLREDYKKRSKD